MRTGVRPAERRTDMMTQIACIPFGLNERLGDARRKVRTVVGAAS